MTRRTRPHRRATLLAGLLLAMPALGAPRPEARAEIEHLLVTMRGSGCQFNRNGQWHDAERAAQHLRDKYEAMLKRGLITTAESFIDRGASASSMSGTAYEVRCATGAAQPSGAWMHAELKRHRQAKAAAPASTPSPSPAK
jgi:Family of unknown function (DUF5329)